LLGVQAFKGRTFLPEEDRTKLSHPVVVVSYTGWQRRFGSDPDLVGKEVLLNNHPFTVIGIAPQNFRGTEMIYTPDMFVPISMLEWIEPGSTWVDNRDSRNFFAIGRLKPGVTSRQAEGSLNILAKELGKQYPNSNEGLTPVSTRFHHSRLAQCRGQFCVDLDGGGGAGPPCSLRESCRFVVGARNGSPEGDRDSFGAGRKPLANNPSVAH
jgi:hypothetical protein